MTGVGEFADLHDDLRSVARDLLRDDVAWERAADAGWFGLEVPEHLGGAGATFAETAVIATEIGRATARLAFTGTALGVAAASSTAASPERDALLADTATGSARLAVATSRTLDTVTATPAFTLDGGVLSGRADFVVDAPDADRLLVVADTKSGPALIALDARRAHVESVEVLDATRSVGAVDLDGVGVDGHDVWPFDAPDGAQRIHDRAALVVALDAAGVAAAAAERTVDYARNRHQFGRAIGSFQAVKHRCADMEVARRVGDRLLDAAVAAVVAGADSASVAVSRAKSYVTAAAVDVVGGAMQLHGGIGYTWESGVHASLKRVTLDRALYGSPAEHRRRVGERFRA